MRRKTFTLACGALALALGAAAEEQGRVLGVRAHSDDRASSVEIDGDRPLSFTTMKLLSPPRVVVDFADAEIAAEQRELEIEDGTLRRAAIAQAGSRTARVVIELAVDAEFDVRADGNRVEVRVPRPGAVATAGAASDAEAEKVASLPKVSLVGSKPAQPPEEASRARTAAEKAEALKKVLAEQRRHEAEEKAARKLGKKSGGKLAITRPAPQPPKPAAPADTEASTSTKELPGPDTAPASNAVTPARSAAETVPPQASARTEEPSVRPAEPSVQPAEPPVRPAEPSVRPAEPPVERAEEASVAPAPPAARGHRITGIGFRPVRGGEVIVRSDQPLEYGVSDDASAVLLHLPSAAITLPNNRRPLDTRFFGGAVQRVVPMPVPGGTDVRIELREHAEYQLAQSGSVLTVTFAPSH